MDLSHWLNDDQVMAQIGISARTLHRQVQAGQWHPQHRPRPGNRPERVFDPEELRDKLPQQPARVVPQSKAVQPISPPVAALAEPPISWPAIISLVEHFVELHQTKPQALWVKLQEASQITGLSVTFLRRLTKRGKLESVKDRSIKVPRAALDQLDLGRGKKRLR